MTLNIEMFSRAETVAFGLAVAGLIIVALLLTLTIEKATAVYVKLTNKKEDVEYPRVEVRKNDFDEIGKMALRNQTMLSFKRETSLGKTIEVINVDMFEEG